MELLQIFQNRRSVRQYTDAPIPEEMLTKILQAGLLSASGKAIRPWEFIVVRNRETLNALAGCRTTPVKMLQEAACAIVVLGDESKLRRVGGGLLRGHGQYAPDGRRPGRRQLLGPGPSAGGQ